MESVTQNAIDKDRSAADSPVDSLDRTDELRTEDERPLESSVKSWLEWQCGLFKGVLHSSLFLTSRTDPSDSSIPPTAGSQISNQRIASWPDRSIQTRLLLPIASQAVCENKPISRAMSTTGDRQTKSSLARSLLCLAIPLRVENTDYVLVMVLTERPEAERSLVIQLVQWGARCLPLLAQSESGQTPSSQTRHASVSINQRIADDVLAQSSFYSKGMSLVMQLAEELGCERVSLGWMNGSEIDVVAISGVSTVDRRMQMVRNILLMMKECSDQALPVQSSQKNSNTINREHVRFAASEGIGKSGIGKLGAGNLGGGNCSIPILWENRCIGVLLFEKQSQEPFYASTITWCERLLRDITPSLISQRENESPGFRRVLARMKESVRRILPGEFSQLRLITIVLLFLILCASIIEGTYTVTAAATIEGQDKQVVVAPYDGFVLDATARSGERVEAGQRLAALDARGLSVERDRWLSELSKVEKSYHHALATGDRVELRMLQSRRQEIEAEQALIDQKIERAQLIAPFSGVIVTGDLSQKLGAPVKAGQVLYEVASVDQYRLVLDVNEHQIARIAENKTARLRLNALPGEVHSIALSGMLPIAQVVDGNNVFRFDADFVTQVENLRPGMRGYARLDAGEHSLLWIWTEGLIHRLRVLFWSLGF